VILSLRLRHGSLWLEYRDETGESRVPAVAAAPPGWRAVPLVASAGLPPLPASDLTVIDNLRGRFGAMWVPTDLEQLLESGYIDLPEVRNHWTPAGTSEPVPWLLPVFLSPPPGIEAVAWEHIVETVLLQHLPRPHRCVLLRLARHSWKPRPAFELPLTILDASDPPADWLADIRRRHWYADNEAVREAGVRLEYYTGRGPHPRQLRPSQAHIVLERTSGRRLLEDATARARRSKGRLFVAFSDYTLEEVLSGSVGALPHGASLLIQQGPSWVSDADIKATVAELVYTQVHDFALHEVLWLLRHALPLHYFLVASDPAANQALRLSRVMRRIVDDTLALTLPSAASDASGALRAAWEQVSQIAFDFSFESRGLTEMAQLVTGPIRKARAAADTVGRSVEAIDAETRERARETQTRRTDIALEQYNAFGVLTPMDESSRRTPLRVGWPYRLRVHIGQRDPTFSAVEGEVPPIDSLLPPARPREGHTIEVAVFEKSFRLLSPGIQVLQLPPFGGSTPVYFELRAPMTTGPADLRIALYHENNLLQSFVLEADVALQPQPTDRVLVRVRLASSGTARFGNLDELGARALSVALNDDAIGGHTVMLKAGNLRESIALTEKQVEQHMSDFRGLLGNAINAQSMTIGRLFPPDPPPSAERDREFESYLRQFARIGHDIWKRILERPGVDTATLLELKRGACKPIQFIRHGKLLPFPWQTIYDYRLPEGNAFDNATVCFANTPVEREPGPRESGCPHHPGKAVVCVEGFWSVRHLLEQISEDPAAAKEQMAGGATSALSTLDRVSHIDVPPGNPLVCLGMGTDDLAARSLKQALQQQLSDDLRILTDADKPIEEILWDMSCRPGLLVVLSHLEPAEAKSNLPARIAAVVSTPPRPPNVISGEGLLQHKLYHQEWKAPRPFVLLMACESAQVQLQDLTNLVDTFFGVGAAAVAGTESDVISDLAADFAKQITLGLTTGKQRLGELLRTYTEGMLKRRNPLPFAFSVFGSAKLTVKRVAP
jgi:hypothetical protein